MGPPSHDKTSKEVTQHGQANKTLYVLRDGKPQRVNVVTGLTDGVHTEIVSGDVKANDQVIVDQQRKAK